MMIKAGASMKSRRVIIAALGLSCALFITSCGQSKDTETTTQATTAATTEATTEATTAVTTEATTVATTEAATEAAPAASSEGAKAFEGEWTEEIAHRGMINISPVDDKSFTIGIFWGSSAFEQAVWTMTGTFNESTGKLEYKDCKYLIRTYTDEENYTDDVKYEDGTGTFYIEGGKLCWKSDKSDIDGIDGSSYFINESQYTDSADSSDTTESEPAYDQSYKDKLTDSVIKSALNVPDDAEMFITISEPYFWDGGATYLVPVEVTGTGKDEGRTAYADFDMDGNPVKSILAWQ